AAEMFAPERRARGMSFVLFAAVSGAIFGPLIFGPVFANRALTPNELAWPWLASSLFALGGLLVSFGIRHDPKELSKAYATVAQQTEAPAPLGEILRRPGVPTALAGAVASFAVMVGVMNLAGYVAVGHHHKHGVVYTAAGSVSLAVFAAALAALPALWIALLPFAAGGRLVRRFSV